MRLLVVLLAAGLVPVFVTWQQHHYETDLRPDLAAEVGRVLSAPGFDRVRAELNQLDVTLSGTVDDFVLRRRAEIRVDALPGARVRPLDNRIRVTPVLGFRREAARERIEGRLHSEDLRTLETAVARRALAEAAEIRVQGHPLVEILQPRQRRLLLAATTEFMTLPGPRSLTLSGDRVELQGAITLQRLARLWERAGPGEDLERLFYQGPLSASLYHLPGYRSETGPDAETAIEIRRRLAAARVGFGDDATAVEERERDRLEALADVIRSAGDRARFVIGGHVPVERTDDIQAGIELGRARAEAVRQALVELGLDAERLEVIDFGPTRLAGDPAETDANGVEVLLK